MKKSMVILCAMVLFIGIFSLGITEASLVNPGFEVDEPTGGGLPNSFGDWAGDYSEIVTAKNGITPLEGIRMLEFLGTTRSGPGTGSSGVCQLIDVSAYSNEILEGRVNVYVSAFYNRVLGNNQTDTLFYLWLAAHSGVPSSFPSESTRLILVLEPIITDGLVDTWEMESLNLWLPVNTSYLALQVIAAQNVSPYVNSGLYPNFDGHYADNVTMIFDIAPIPEPATMLLLSSGLVGLAQLRGKLRKRVRVQGSI